MSQEPTARMDAANLAELIRELGYKAKIGADAQFIASSTSGIKFVIEPFETGSMLFSLSVTNDIGYGLAEANRFNRENRFIRLYIGRVEGETDLVLEADFSGPPHEPQTWLQASFDRWERSIEMLKNALTTFADGQTKA